MSSSIVSSSQLSFSKSLIRRLQQKPEFHLNKHHRLEKIHIHQRHHVLIKQQQHQQQLYHSNAFSHQLRHLSRNRLPEQQLQRMSRSTQPQRRVLSSASQPPQEEQPPQESSVSESAFTFYSGIIFFGTLCFGTLGLGMWQCKRLIEKTQLQKQRNDDIKQIPLNGNIYLNNTNNDNNTLSDTSFRRISINGQYQHEYEMLIGPRGPPTGALPHEPGLSGQGLSSSPQGYYIVTPFQLLSSNDKNNTMPTTILVNRGWVPRNRVIHERHNPNSRNNRRNNNKDDEDDILMQWDRPIEPIDIIVVPTQLEVPRFLVAGHNFRVRPPILYWYDKTAMLACARMPLDDDDEDNTTNDDKTALQNNNKIRSLPLYVTQIAQDNNHHNTTWPICSPYDKIGEFKVTKEVHAGYAFTWFSLSAAGFYMTRMLLTKGR